MANSYRLAPAHVDLPIAAEVHANLRPEKAVAGRFWDGLLFGFSASLALWQDLTPKEVAIVLIVMFGAALVALGSGE